MIHTFKIGSEIIKPFYKCESCKLFMEFCNAKPINGADICIWNIEI